MATVTHIFVASKHLECVEALADAARGIRLNDLRGKRFRIGGAVFEGLELCEPCSLFAKRTHREVLEFFIRKGGLRARIITGGEIRVGESIAEDQ